MITLKYTRKYGLIFKYLKNNNWLFYRVKRSQKVCHSKQGNTGCDQFESDHHVSINKTGENQYTNIHEDCPEKVFQDTKINYNKIIFFKSQMVWRREGYLTNILSIITVQVIIYCSINNLFCQTGVDYQHVTVRVKVLNYLLK